MLAAIGQRTLGFGQPLIRFLSDAVAVLWQSCRPITWRRPVRAEFMHQCFQVGTRALPFILVSGILAGFGMVAQALYWLEVFGGTALFGGILSLVLVREVAPLLVGLIVIGRSGSTIMVELGTMKAAGQVHMLDAQGIDPFLYLVVPRVLAVSISMFCLTIAFIAVAMLAGFVSASFVGTSTYSFFDFFDAILSSIGRKEYILITLKTFIIGFVVALISCRTALSVAAPVANVLDILPRGFAKSVLSAMLISAALTLLL
jgi:phospholipid/cholesterol/gamma-HCH transport system permease protein